MARNEADAAPQRPLIRVLHGPNLNLLGSREPEVYGTATLAEIENLVHNRAELVGLTCEFLQSNHEGDLVEAVQGAGREAHGIIINGGALTHYSMALTDALSAVTVPVVEVHLTNIYARDAWRRESVISPVVTACLCGFGQMGYVFAVDAMAGFLAQQAGESAQGQGVA
ncbi:MAG: 3-dehydroquinate dehydratase [Acidimicrobiia bacterium]|nr:3-dehydroquinate dehydratase [Acidimicrobiia bacterium]